MEKQTPFKQDNLIPWSIVGFDVKERTPEQRLAMLEELGFKQYAYGHRLKHIPTMKHEWQLAKEKGIDIKAVWLYINLAKDKPGSLREQTEAVFENLAAVNLHTQIWVGFDPKYFQNLSNQQALKEAVEMVSYLSKRASSLGSKVALYNHGGWFGKPENQIKIINSLPKHDIGVVFNFHHGHDTLNDYNKNIKMLMPYLWCVNLNGMKSDGPKIVTLGEGNLEQEMIQLLLDLNYQGPFGLLGHVKGGDPAVILQQNLDGLRQLFPKQS
ncbi:sugar phosphate isomerase/epimerase family protein [Thalassomonas sp. M1454]|uniref:sugar phosphate isomerase/epimerase family protein n=1 Tax=Thalassomonas sp. M1454 TaxID=2594477 RepID=UPI00117EC6DE|nr:TIM barrel protein [Thalassomonas sp. M1454]TRX52468.1 AP endonuclease [Thalassomonas sp. M1454]